MSYGESQKVDVKVADHERLVRLLGEVGDRLGQVRSMLNPAADDWPLQPGEVGVILLPSNPPETACILEHPDTGHWMLQYPCDGIFIADLTKGS
jgi:hypothetical protein